ncbi:TetR/AcrR family transcriptional regulator [Lapidilactobacillus achengensis]|uniref:TetR/AcrR family transcriptional regulator n=1 Tax=Lapidilactobacillus achengensis TaxID=2486000 RepID=A0ABW1UQZ0_9LACO|nr:TetR/AcrR family transcriptional regulator [Lapidilactobacillus achengensis]
MQKRNLNQQRIIETAAQIVNETGAAALTFSNVANALGVRPQALYAYFGNREQLKFALIVSFLDSLTKNLNTALVGISGEQGLIIYGSELHRSLLAEPNLTKLAFGGINYQQESEAGQHLHQLVLVLDRLLAPYYDNDREVIAQARYLRALIFGYVQNELWGLFSHPDLSANTTFNEALTQAVTNITKEGVVKHG